MKTSMGMLRRAIICGIAVILGAASAHAQTRVPAVKPFSELVVFGDSLSDTGNAGRFTDGAVWVEVLARRLDLDLRASSAGGSNYAVGGARSHGGATDIRGQLRRYLDSSAKPLDPEVLFVVWGGANDLLAAGCAPGRDAATTAAAAMRASVDELAAAGARTVIVANLPDVGHAPIVRAQGPACTQTARRLTGEFNMALERGMRDVEARRGVRILLLDVFGLAERVIADPSAAGLRDGSDRCPPGACDGALFADALHPSAGAHAIIAEAALRELAAPD